MLLTILAFLASLVPSILIFVLLKRRHGKVKKEIENKADDTTAETMPLSGENEAQDTEPSPVSVAHTRALRLLPLTGTDTSQ